MSRAEIQREKLLNAMIFFTKNTRECHQLKLFKLLYFLDFDIYRETGRSTTGLSYFAFPMGPVPERLYAELDAPASDMSAALSITRGALDPDFGNSKTMSFRARRAFDDGCFTTRELSAMERLVEIYSDATSTMMTLASHDRGLPWRQIYEVEKKHQGLIPFELVLDDKPGSITKAEAKQIADEARELVALFK